MKYYDEQTTGLPVASGYARETQEWHADVI